MWECAHHLLCTMPVFVLLKVKKMERRPKRFPPCLPVLPSHSLSCSCRWNVQLCFVFVLFVFTGMSGWWSHYHLRLDLFTFIRFKIYGCCSWVCLLSLVCWVSDVSSSWQAVSTMRWLLCMLFEQMSHLFKDLFCSWKVPCLFPCLV